MAEKMLHQQTDRQTERQRDSQTVVNYNV